MADITKGHTFSAGDEVNETKLNALVDDATIANIATADILDTAITAAKLAASAVETAKIANNAVTTAKIADSQVTTAKIADSAVTEDKLDHLAILLNEDTAPTTIANQGGVYTKNDGTQTELYFKEESDGDEVQITKGGSVLTKMYYSGAQVYSGNSPTSFTDLDLSAKIGAVRALVFLKVKPTGGGIEVKFRPNGDSDDIGNEAGATYLGGGASAATIVQNRVAYLVCMTDGAGVVEWDSAGAVTTVITLQAYIVLR